MHDATRGDYSIPALKYKPLQVQKIATQVLLCLTNFKLEGVQGLVEAFVFQVAHQQPKNATVISLKSHGPAQGNQTRFFATA